MMFLSYEELIISYFMASKSSKKTIAVVGLWHLGSVYAASFLKMGFSVVGYDSSKKVIANFTRGVPPLFEPGLEETLVKYKKKILFSSSPFVLKDKDYIFVTHDVVVDEYDVAEIRAVEIIFKNIAKHVHEKTTIVIISGSPSDGCFYFQRLQ